MKPLLYNSIIPILGNNFYQLLIISDIEKIIVKSYIFIKQLLIFISNPSVWLNADINNFFHELPEIKLYENNTLG